MYLGEPVAIATTHMIRAVISTLDFFCTTNPIRTIGIACNAAMIKTFMGLFGLSLGWLPCWRVWLEVSPVLLRRSLHTCAVDVGGCVEDGFGHGESGRTAALAGSSGGFLGGHGFLLSGVMQPFQEWRGVVSAFEAAPEHDFQVMLDG